LEHALGQIEAGNEGVSVGVADQEARVAAVAAAGVEDAFATADVEGPRPDQAAGQRLVAGDQPGQARQFAGQAVVVVFDEAAVVSERLAPRFLRFQDSTKTFTRGRGGRLRDGAANRGGIHGSSLAGGYTTRDQPDPFSATFKPAAHEGPERVRAAGGDPAPCRTSYELDRSSGRHFFFMKSPHSPRQRPCQVL